MIIKLLALFFPLLLFIFKYMLPSLAEAVYNNKGREKKQSKIELIHFPVDLLFVAISYRIPEIVEVGLKLLEIVDKNTTNSVLFSTLLVSLIINGIKIAVILLFIPFMVFFTKLSVNNYFKGKKTWLIQTLVWYAIAFAIIGISLFVE